MASQTAATKSLQTGPGRLSTQAIERVASLAAERAVTLSVSDDFDELLQVNTSNRGSWDPLMPQFHPAYFDPRRSSAFWIKGVDQTGHVIAARGYRRFDLPRGKTLWDALTDLSLFYDDPTMKRSLERVECDSVFARAIEGSFAFSGALWIHPECRRLGLSSLMWPIGRSVTYDLWDVPYLFALVEDVPKMQSVLGFEGMERGTRWYDSYVGPYFDLTLVWWTRARLAQDVDAFLRKNP